MVRLLLGDWIRAVYQFEHLASHSNASPGGHIGALTAPVKVSIVHMHIIKRPMPRPCKRRYCRAHHGDRVFKPRKIPMSELATIRLELSELEAMRLCDVERRDQEQAGQRMGVSRGTVQRLLKSGRSKVIKALVESAALVIEKGERDEDLHPDCG